MHTQDNQEKAIAWFQRLQRREVEGQAEVIPAFLAIENEALDCRDEVVVACLILEHRIRMSEKYAMIQGLQCVRGVGLKQRETSF